LVLVKDARRIKGKFVVSCCAFITRSNVRGMHVKCNKVEDCIGRIVVLYKLLLKEPAKKEFDLLADSVRVVRAWRGP